MSFCPKCGTLVAPDTSSCPKCNASLQVKAPLVPTKRKGDSLEDLVANYFGRMGFDIQTRARMRDRYDVAHEIDVLASKKEAYGTIQVAVECKHVKSPINIKEVRNFHDKLVALGITKGIFVSTGGFTADARSHAQALGIELWEETTVLEKTAAQEAGEREDVIHDALPVHPDSIKDLSPKHILNYRMFSENIQLLYKPYYFVDYHCFSEHTAGGESIVLESKGTAVLDAVTGELVDSKVSEGIEPAVPSARLYVRCLDLQPQTLTAASMPRGIARAGKIFIRDLA